MFGASRPLKQLLPLYKCVCVFNGANCVSQQRNYFACSDLYLLLRTDTRLHNQSRFFSFKPRKRVFQLLENEDSDDVIKEDNYLESVIKSEKLYSHAEWETIKDKAINTMFEINHHNIDAKIIVNCSRFQRLDMGLSYINYLLDSGKKLNIATVSNFMRLCYNCRHKGVDEKLILSMYEDVCSRHPVLDGYTCEALIIGLCITSRWKEGLKLLDMAKLSCMPAALECNALVKAAFDNNDRSTAFHLIDELLQSERRLNPEAYHSWLNYYDRVSGQNPFERWKLTENLLNQLAENDLQITVDVAERIRNWCLETKENNSVPHADFTTLSERGICKSCRNNLNPIHITNEEFKTLQTAFMDKVIVGSDIFRKTSPEELKKYTNFVKMTAPYDIVIDGLNVAYATGSKKPLDFAKTLHLVVKHFVMKSKKVLVLGRKHMELWPSKYMDYIYKNSHIFLAQNMSQDDPFLLYAALYSGLGTFVLSKDFMRGHAYLLKSKILRSTFRRWQLQHQYQLKYVTDAGKVHLKYPLTFSPMAQCGRNGTWHIPYEKEFTNFEPQIFETPSQWLCLGFSKSAKKKVNN